MRIWAKSLLSKMIQLETTKLYVDIEKIVFKLKLNSYFIRCFNLCNSLRLLRGALQFHAIFESSLGCFL